MSRAVGNLVSNVNVAKITSSAASAAKAAAKNVDMSSVLKKAKNAIPSTTVFKKASVLKSGKKTSKQMVASMNEFASHPGAKGKLSQVAGAMKRNPKIAAAGITSTAAAGYVAFRMAEGATFAEAFDELTDVAGDIVKKVADTAVSVVGGTTDKLLTSLLGENYKMYLYAAGAVWVIIMLFKIKRLLF